VCDPRSELPAIDLLRHAGRQEVRKTDAAIHLAAHPIGDAVHHFGSVLGRIDMNTEGALAKGSIDDSNDLTRDLDRIGVGWLETRKTFECLIRDTGVGARFILSDTGLVGGCTGVRKVIRALREGTRNHDGGLDAPAGELR
jgi:hypothetical protein